VARKTKIVATLGPASDSPRELDRLIAAGMDVARLNLSHATPQHHLAVLAEVRKASARAARAIGVLVDLPGPKVRTGIFSGNGGVHLTTGEQVRLVPGDGPGTDTVITVDYPPLVDDVRVGDVVILGDGAITMKATTVDAEGVVARVVTGGRAVGRPGVHLPSERLRLSAPTPQDLALLDEMLPARPDFVAVSFVRSAGDVAAVRERVGPDGPLIVAKIETAGAVGDLAEICEVADAVMVARGDLGIECPLEDVPLMQKEIVRTCVEEGVPVITATQMLETMIRSPLPTRAEVSDVANAVFDGTDALMLSAETAIGDDPATVVATMARIAERAEDSCDYPQWGGRLGRIRRRAGTSDAARITQAITHAAWLAAADAEVAAIICCTRSGLTARAMARYRPPGRLIGMSPRPATVSALTLSWGVVPLEVATYTNTDEMVWCVVEAAVQAGVATSGERVAVLAGAPDATDGPTDVLRIIQIR
jgi:pyruvate kinase